MAASEVDLNGFSTPTPDSAALVVHLSNAAGAFVHGCQASAGTRTFLSVEGDASRDVALGDNDCSCAVEPVCVAADVPSGIVSGSGFEA